MNIQDSYSDSLDADFSNIDFKNIDIRDSGNDCIDLSAGRYSIINANLERCKDKAISVGEKASAFFDYVNISDSYMGIASKDSSIVRVKNALLKNTQNCFSAYNKKQEFWTGKIDLGKSNCGSNQEYLNNTPLFNILP